MRTSFKTMLLAALLPFCAAAPLQAAEEDTQYWIDAQLRWSLDDVTSAAVDFSPRFSDDAVRRDALLMRLNVSRALADWVAIGGGFTVVENSGPGREMRPHQEVTLRAAGITLRSRLEQRTFDGGRPNGLRLREALGTSIALDERNAVRLGAEVFFRLKDRGALGSGFEQVWFTADLRHRLTDHATVGAGYRAIYVERTGREDSLSHVPRLIVHYEF